MMIKQHNLVKPVNLLLPDATFFVTRMYNKSPCLTATRCENGGHWLSWKRRRMTTSDMLRLMGLDPDVHTIPKGFSIRQFNRMIGMAMSLNVVQPIMRNLMSSAGLL